jgi:branched-subunit amino acid ABC-type transport system permease component
MSSFLQFTIFGLATGVLYALAAAGIVLTYTTSGIFNFAHGAIAMLSACVFWQLDVVWHLPLWLAFIIVAFLVGPAIEFGIYWVILRKMEGTSELSKIVVTISVMLFLVALTLWIWSEEGQAALRSIDPFWGTSAHVVWHVGAGNVYLSYHAIFTFVVAALIGAGLFGMFKFSRMGIAMRAVVDNPSLVQLNGGKPGVLAATSWAMSGSMAAIAGILIVPIQGSLEANSLTVLILTGGITAAIIGRLRSIPLTIFGGILVGLATNYFTSYAPSEWSTWKSQFGMIIPMLILFAVLLWQPQERLRGVVVMRTRERFKPASMRAAVTAGAVLVVVCLAFSRILGTSDLLLLSSGLALSVVGLSLTLLTGYAGEMNLAPLAFAGLGALIAFFNGSIGVEYAQYISVPGIFLTVVAVAIIGGIVALPALRLRGLYLALATFAFGSIVASFIFGQTNPVDLNVFGLFHQRFSFLLGDILLYARGIKVGPINIGIDSPQAMLVYFGIIFALLGIGMTALRRSSYGRRLIAMKDSPAAVATLGQDITRLKVSAFMVSSGIAALGGILYAVAIGNLSGGTFAPLVSLGFVMICVVGGIGSVSGALFGGVLFSVGLVAVQSTFHALWLHHGQTGGVFTWGTAWHLSTLLPAMIGIGLGGNPSGQVAGMIRDYSPIWKTKKVFWATMVFLTVTYAFTLFKVWGNWWFVLCVVIAGFAAPLTTIRILEKQVKSESSDANDQQLVNA